MRGSREAVRRAVEEVRRSGSPIISRCTIPDFVRAFAVVESYFILESLAPRTAWTTNGAEAISTAAPQSGVIPALHLPTLPALPALKLPRPPGGWYGRLRA